MRSVCIVGAGAAGLATLKNFLVHRQQFGEILCYEQTKVVGGTWNYVPDTGTDENGLSIHSSMYKNLRANLSKQIMEYPDFEFVSDDCFMRHEVVLEYLNDYCSHFELFGNIQFESVVRRISRDEQHSNWNVTLEKLREKTLVEKQFDVVILCHGHYSTPLYSGCPGLEKFKGRVVHSHDYRSADVYKDETVLIIGAGFSGLDIAIELTEVSEKVYLLDRKPKPKFTELGNVCIINGNLLGFGESSVQIRMNKDEQEITTLEGVDTVLVCTGYKMNFDFLDSNCGISVNSDNTVNGLYKHIINIKHSSMACIGVNTSIPPFKLFHIQSLFYLKSLLGIVELPPQEEMNHLNDEEMSLKLSLGQRPKDRHRFPQSLVEKYFRELEQEAGLGMVIKPVTFAIYYDIHRNMVQIPLAFKKLNYRTINDYEFERDDLP